MNAEPATYLISPGSKAIPGTVVGQILNPASPEGQQAQRIYDLDLCRECGKRKATMTWGDSLAFTHGTTSGQCDICVYGAQLSHALNRFRIIPSLAFRLARAHLVDQLDRLDPMR